jgi:hypothetical protein
MYDKTIRLTKKTATQLIHQIMPHAKISKDDTVPEVTIFRTVTDPNGLEIRCENDWFKRNQRIKLTITDGENTIVHYYSPTTLNRDFIEEELEKKEIALEARVRWVSQVGLEMAHKLVDHYWEE